jgi:hypothetical protein
MPNRAATVIGSALDSRYYLHILLNMFNFIKPCSGMSCALYRIADEYTVSMLQYCEGSVKCMKSTVILDVISSACSACLLIAWLNLRP